MWFKNLLRLRRIVTAKVGHTIPLMYDNYHWLGVNDRIVGGNNMRTHTALPRGT